MNGRIISIPLTMSAFMMIGPINPNAFYFEEATELVAGLGESRYMAALGIAGLLFLVSIFFVITTSCLDEKSSKLQNVMAYFTVGGATLGAFAMAIYVTLPDRMFVLLTTAAAHPVQQWVMAVVGIFFGLFGLLALFGCFPPTQKPE